MLYLDSMKINPKVILKSLDNLTTKLKPDDSPWIPLADLVASVRNDTGVEVPEKSVRDAIEALAENDECSPIEQEGPKRAKAVQRYTDEMRTAWHAADELAEVLGGTAEKLMAEPFAVISMTIEQARAAVGVPAKSSPASKKDKVIPPTQVTAQ